MWIHSPFFDFPSVASQNIKKGSDFCHFTVYFPENSIISSILVQTYESYIEVTNTHLKQGLLADSAAEWHGVDRNLRILIRNYIIDLSGD